MSIFLKAINSEKVHRPPIWLMRQAGRYLSEYRETRKNAGSFLELCYNSDLATEVTLQPINKFGFDAAILFADILLILDALGIKLEFIEGLGPRLEPVRNANELNKLKSTSDIHEKLGPVYQTIKSLKKNLPTDVPLIGFAGAPWTLATYMINGKGENGSITTKKFLLSNTKDFDRIIDILTEATIEYLLMQVDAGADVIKIFDSWAGALNADMVFKYSFMPIKKIVKKIKSKYPDLPFIVFPRAVNTSYSTFANEGSFDVLAMDQFLDRRWISEMIQPKKVIQGNLDPIFLTLDKKPLLDELDRVINSFNRYPFIFNLGHGITPDAKIDNVELMVDYIKKINIKW
jgi:uroporphyrinogen decarboxylase